MYIYIYIYTIIVSSRKVPPHKLKELEERCVIKQRTGAKKVKKSLNRTNTPT